LIGVRKAGCVEEQLVIRNDANSLQFTHHQTQQSEECICYIAACVQFSKNWQKKGRSTPLNSVSVRHNGSVKKRLSESSERNGAKNEQTGITRLGNHSPLVVFRHHMDALKAEIASKRKALDNVPQRPKKYMRRGEIERMKEEEEQKAREEAAKRAEARKIALAEVRSAIPSKIMLKILRRRWSLESRNQPFRISGTFITQRFTLDRLSRSRGHRHTSLKCRRGL
jgi:hypothetical protein